ncbi:MAG: quinol:cytochrome C oxidoreductase [Melioribacteraceae bacterium]|nr:quinol:cytochrome C oxidoreductase [Melioribacteraceae bacterium]MCF8264016.1 quinol:cytochrome C oxidoreductase [Melioribacteraceae bacterium]MCF8412700.1 quinol:cytochrome C oxidoreductase [Melioribacteraceae bacterium]MCF8431781.1 quinol:cytochrome C oxidoreductase [Melioribacteraceae bacterium]
MSKIATALIAIGLIGVILAYLFDTTRASFNGLVMLMFVTSIGAGSVFLIAIEYLGGAVWSTPFRRVSEFLGAVVFLLPLLALPVYLNLHSIFEWTHLEVVEADKILSGKSAYLNPTFFTVRVIIFFSIWILFYLILTRNSKKQDSNGDQNLTKINIKVSAIFIPFFGLTLTFAAIDWIMSLEPHWFSTIFGVYYFSGTMLAALSFATILIVYLNEKGYFVKGISKDNYYSLGALLFAFVNFWAYIAFSQFLLIWYANLPEETFWYLARWDGAWKYVTISTIFIHFLLPYIVLAPQPAKKDPKRLIVASVIILFAHFLDIFWLVMPTFGKESFAFGWIEIAFPILAVGLILFVFVFKYKSENLVPIRDPKLKRGLNFRL